MRGDSRRLLVPAAVVIGLFATTAPQAFAASTPTPQTITGIVQTVIREQPRGQQTDANDTTKVLNVGTKIVPLTDGSLLTTEDGTKVSATVAPASDGTKNVLSATTISAPLAAAISPVHQVYVALVRPLGVAADASITDTSARAMVTRVSQYWSDQTGNKVSFNTAQVQGYLSAYSCASTYSMWTEALGRMPAASAAGSHLVVVAPTNAPNCAYGLGTIGAVEASGNKVFVSGLNQSLLAHELGHNMGLYHSNALRCSGTQDLPRVGVGFPGCVANDYDDLFDVMGYSGTDFGEGNLNAVHLDGMNLLPTAVRRIAANSGVTTAHITALSTTTDARTLKVTDPNGENYFVEYRTNSGRDAVAGVNRYHPSWGVRVLRDDPDAPASAGSYELDTTPTSLSNDYNRSLAVGSTFTAASHNLTIKVTAADSAGATLDITNGTGSVPPAPPAPSRVTISIPTRASVGAAITASTKVTDQYGQPIANWTVTLQKVARGTSTWRSLKAVRTSSTGAASYRFTNGVSGSYRWVTRAATGAPIKFSPSMAVTSTARVAAKRPATTMTHGRYLSVSGTVSSVPSPVVYIQYRYRGGAWHNGPRATVRGTTVSGRIKLNLKSTAYTRLYVRRATAYVGSVSNSRTTTVR